MMRIDARTDEERARALPLVVEHMRRDGLIAYPTETVYGFGGTVSRNAVTMLRALKRRDAAKPFLLLVAGAEQAAGVRWTHAARELANRFWPGPLTLVLEAEPDAYPAGIIADDGTVAIRASPHPFVQALTRAWGEPITSSSANVPGTSPARDADAVAATLETLMADQVLVADDVLVIDGGALPASAPSTIVAVEDHSVRVVRAGAIGVDELTNELSGTGIHVG